MIKYNAGDPKRIQHSIKVHSYSKLIGQLENLNKKTLFILESAAILHDIGIKNCEAKYNNTSGPLQEKEGKIVGNEILKSLNYKESYIKRILFLISNHHSYDKIDNIDFQILVEADFIVNIEEENSKENNSIYKNLFKTKNGKIIFKEMFN
jgi:hypothetical protein